MHVKILMCVSNKNAYKSEDNPYVKHLIHFTCKCPKDHEIFNHFFDLHSFGNKIPQIRDYTGTIRDKCYCSKLTYSDIWLFCTQVSYVLNFACHKICIEDTKDIRNFLEKNKVVSFDQYLKQISCEPFFYFENNCIHVSLNNPRYDVPVKTDSRHVFYRS